MWLLDLEGMLQTIIKLLPLQPIWFPPLSLFPPLLLAVLLPLFLSLFLVVVSLPLLLVLFLQLLPLPMMVEPDQVHLSPQLVLKRPSIRG